MDRSAPPSSTEESRHATASRAPTHRRCSPPPPARLSAAPPVGLWDGCRPRAASRLVATLSALVERRLADARRRAGHEPSRTLIAPRLAFEHKITEPAPRAAGGRLRAAVHRHQVLRHQESTQLQYGLAERASRLGWPRARVLVIDDDLGLSGASADGRPGFQRLLGEVALDHVGLILGVEMSRLARSCKDWYQLLELCALFGTLIGDLDGLYDPSSYNDRLLLGLKGTMSEAELHILRQRMQQGALQKARRGELVSKVPIGYVRTPRRRGRRSTRTSRSAPSSASSSTQFERIGTRRPALLRWMARAGGPSCRCGPTAGPDKGQLQWRRPELRRRCGTC